MELTPEQIRVLGCLIEKELTTPDHYPLTTNSLVAACNQKSNRDPVVEFDERTVDAAMLSLRDLGLARTITGSGRALKHRHVLQDALQLDRAALALLGVLALRGAQTTGELRSRTERAHDFADLAEVETSLEQLSARPDALVQRLERRPGQKEARWVDLLGGERAAPDAPPAHVGGSTAQPARTPTTFVDVADDPRAEFDELRRELAELRQQVLGLYALLGEEPPV